MAAECVETACTGENPVLPCTTLSDIHTEFCARFGWENPFPVARTEIGNFGPIARGEPGFPENARCTLMNGAEIPAHLASEPPIVAGDKGGMRTS